MQKMVPVFSSLANVQRSTTAWIDNSESIKWMKLTVDCHAKRWCWTVQASCFRTKELKMNQYRIQYTIWHTLWTWRQAPWHFPMSNSRLFSKPWISIWLPSRLNRSNPIILNTSFSLKIVYYKSLSNFISTGTQWRYQFCNVDWTLEIKSKVFTSDIRIPFDMVENISCDVVQYNMLGYHQEALAFALIVDIAYTEFLHKQNYA